MAPNLSRTRSLKISNYTLNSIACQDRIAASTSAAGTNFRLKTIPSPKGQPCVLEASMVSWLPRRSSRADQENGRPTTSRWLDEWSPLCKTVKPLLTNKRFRASRVALWTATKGFADRSICRGVRPDTSLSGTSRLHRQGETATHPEKLSVSILFMKPNTDRLCRMFLSTRIQLAILIALCAGVCAAQNGKLSSGKLERIDAAVSKFMVSTHVPGMSVAVVENGEYEWAQGFGFADLENNVPASQHTLFRLASISKSLTATAALQLWERGKLDLDAPIQKYCPAFPKKPWPISTRQLLGHLA